MREGDLARKLVGGQLRERLKESETGKRRRSSKWGSAGKEGKALQQEEGKVRKLEKGERRRKRETADAKKDALTGECDITKVVQA